MQAGFLIALVCAALWFSALLIAARMRWFSRFKTGFRLTLSISLISIAVWSSLLIAYWGYDAASQTLVRDANNDLNNLGKVVEEAIHEAITDARQESIPAAMDLAARVEQETAAGPRPLSKELLTDLQQFNPHFLEASVVRGAATAADMHPHYDKELKKYVIDIRTPLQHSDHPPETFVVAYDIQSVLDDLIDKVPFGKTGNMVVVNADGRIIAHRDKSRIHEDISYNEAVRKVRAGDLGGAPVRQRNKAGKLRVYAYRPVTLQKAQSPLTVMAEMDAAELEAPARRLLIEFGVGFGVLTFVSVLMGIQISGYVHQPIHKLLDMIQRVKQGELSATANELGKDEIGQLGAALNEMTHALLDRDRIKELFGRYVTTQVSEEVLKGHVNLGGQERRVTMLISDIRDFTAMSERMKPEDVVQFLNAYFSDMVDAVFEYGGVLDKFLGDGLLAVFGSFGDVPDHPWRAVSAALRMHARLLMINEERKAAGLAPIRIGIGIHTGEVIVGNIGSQKRLEYTVIGDGVNTTSRLESMNKQFSTMILISEATYEAVRDRFECRQMPESILRGKTKPIQFYEVVGAKESGAAAGGIGG